MSSVCRVQRVCVQSARLHRQMFLMCLYVMDGVGGGYSGLVEQEITRLVLGGKG